MKAFIIALSALLVFCCIPHAIAGPTELTETQMTDMSVDNAASDENQLPDENGQKKNTPPPNNHSAMDIIKNPVNDPAEINKPEILRLENQAADQRINDQIQNTIQGINAPE